MQKTFFRGTLIFFLLSFAITPWGFAQTIDNTFKPVFAGPATVQTIAEQADGKVLIGGNFTIAGSGFRKNIARFNADATLDETFSIGEGPDQPVRTIAIQPDGKILVGGFFNTFNGVAITAGIVRLLSDGSIDPSFNGLSAFHGNVDYVNIQSDGKILVSGNVSMEQFSENFGIIRLNADGTIDESFNAKLENNTTSSNAQSKDISVIQPDGKILVGGEFTHVNDQPIGRIARLNPDGSTDETFQVGTGADASVNAIVLQPDGKIIIGGFFNEYNSTATNVLIRLEPDGTVDNTFSSPVNSSGAIKSVSLQADGKLIVTGGFWDPSASICRLNTDGSHDNTFAVGSGLQNGGGLETKVLTDGTVLVGGEFRKYNTTIRGGLVSLGSAGEIVSSKYFFVGGRPTINTTLSLPDGKIVVGGNFLFVNGTPQRYLARLNHDGTHDASFITGEGPSDPVVALVRQPDGKILVGGEFSQYDNSSIRGVVRISEDGTRDATFSGIDQRHGDDGVFDFHLEDDGKIVMAGGFEGKNSIARQNLLRVNADGTLDNTFNASNNIPFNAEITSIVKLDNGNIVAGGRVINSTYFYGALDPAGNPDNTFYTLPETYIYKLLRWNDKIVMGARSGIHVLNQDGTPSSSFAPEGNNEEIKALLIVNDKIVAGGKEGSLQSLKYYNADGSLDPSLHTTFSGGEVGNLALDNDGNILVAGSFSMVEEDDATGLIRVTLDPVPDAPATLSVLSASPTSADLSWTDNSTTETAFELQRAAGTNTDFVTIKTVASNTVSYKDEEIDGNTTYYYRVRAVNVRGESLFSNEASVATAVNPLAGAAPIEGEALGHNEVALTWNNVDGETGYEVYRSDDPNSGYALVGTKQSDEASLNDLTVEASNTYYYKVRVIYGEDLSDYSSSVAVTTLANPLQTPADFTVTAISNNQIKLTWTDNSSVETGFEIYRKRSELEIGGAGTNLGDYEFSLFTTVPAGSVEFVDGDLIPGVEYKYYVQAIRDTERSSGTSIRSAMALAFNTGSWVQKNDFEGGARSSAVQFVIGDKAYVATGADGATRFKDLWEYNSQADDWIQKADFPGAARSGAIGFSIGGKGYVGLGSSAGSPFDVDLYEYDPSDNSWTRKADFPADPASDGGRTSASVFVLKGLAYVVMGNNGVNNPKTVWAYDPASDHWIQKADFPGNGRLAGIAFAIDGKGYAGYGTSLDKYDDLYEYDAETNTWTTNTAYNNPSGRASATMISPGIMITGDDATTFTVNSLKEIYQYIPGVNAWTQWDDFNGVKRNSAIGFRIGNKHYFGLGRDAASLQDFWEYTPATLLPPSIPENMQASYVSNTSLKIAWAQGGDTQTSFTLERSDNPETGFTAVATVAAETNTFLDEGLQPLTIYYYRIKANNADGSSPYAYTNAFTGPVPEKPTDVVLETLSSAEIKLTWKEDLAVASSFDIYRSTSGSNGFEKIHTTPDRQLTFTDTGLTADTEYYYYIRASNLSGTSTSSDTLSAFTIPPVPTLTYSTVTVTESSLRVEWENTFSSATEVEVYRSTDNQTFELVATTGLFARSYIDIDLTPDTDYYYKVKVKNPAGYSGFSNTVTVTTLPLTPSGIQATTESASTVTITWTAGTNPETYYAVYWKEESDVDFSNSLETDPNVSSAEITDLQPDKVYVFGMTAKNVSGESSMSPEVSAYTLSLPPDNVSVTGDAFGNHLSWSDPSSTETEFIIERSDISNDNFTLLAQVSSNTESFTDNALKSGLTYFYRILTMNPGGNSEYSETVQITSALFVGIESTGIAGLSVYPNPVKDKIKVSVASGHSGFALTLTDLQGKTIWSGSIGKNNHETEISMNGLSSGLYILRIAGSKQHESHLIQKQ